MQLKPILDSCVLVSSYLLLFLLWGFVLPCSLLAHQVSGLVHLVTTLRVPIEIQYLFLASFTHHHLYLIYPMLAFSENDFTLLITNVKNV